MYFHIFQLVPNVLNVSFFHLMWAVKKAKNNIILNHSHFGYYCQSFIVLNILMIMGKKGFKSSGFLTSLRTSTHAKFHLKMTECLQTYGPQIIRVPLLQIED